MLSFLFPGFCAPDFLSQRRRNAKGQVVSGTIKIDQLAVREILLAGRHPTPFTLPEDKVPGNNSSD